MRCTVRAAASRRSIARHNERERDDSAAAIDHGSPRRQSGAVATGLARPPAEPLRPMSQLVPA